MKRSVFILTVVGLSLFLSACTYTRVSVSPDPALAPTWDSYQVLKSVSDEVTSKIAQQVVSRTPKTAKIIIVMATNEATSMKLADEIYEKLKTMGRPSVAKLSWEDAEKFRSTYSNDFYYLVIYPIVFRSEHRYITTTPTTRFLLSFLPIIGGLIGKALEYEEVSSLVVVHARLEVASTGAIIWARDFYSAPKVLKKNFFTQLPRY